VSYIGRGLVEDEGDEELLRLLKSGMPRNLAKTLLYVSKWEKGKKKKKKKKKKSILEFYEYDEEDEYEYEDEEEDYIFYGILCYPPGSNPPSPGNPPLQPQFMISDSLVG